MYGDDREGLSVKMKLQWQLSIYNMLKFRS